jgi:hypothetical protein
MYKFRWRDAFIVFIMAGACGKPIPTIEGLNQNDWKNDKNGCSGNRADIVDNIVEERAKLLSLDELKIVALLGKPDQNELYTRNQKFYYYFVDPSPACDTHNAAHQRRLVVRFNAVGLANEILVEE